MPADTEWNSVKPLLPLRAVGEETMEQGKTQVTAVQGPAPPQPISGGCRCNPAAATAANRGRN